MQQFLQADEIKLTELQTELAAFERQFGMTSEQFAAKYQHGEMGDDGDVLSGMRFIRWCNGFFSR